MIGIGVIATIILHLAGMYTKSLKLVWIAIVLFWAVAIGALTNEIKPKGYEDLAKMKGKYPDTDQLIEEAGEKVLFYEMLNIKRIYYAHHPDEEGF